MAIFVKPEAGSSAVAAAAVVEAEAARSAFASADSQPGSSDAGGGPAAPSARALPVYSVEIELLAANASGGLEAAKQSGWRVLTTQDGEKRLVDMAGDEENPVAMAVRGGKSAEMLVKAGALAEKSLDPNVVYEARLLDLGRLGMTSLWLHNDNPETPDHFFTLDVEPMEQTTEELLKKAHSMARQRVECDAEARSAAGREDAPDDLGG